MKKEWFLILASILIILYAVFLNSFFPVEAKKTKSFSGKNKAETELKAEFKHGVNKNVSPEVSGLSFGYLLGEKTELPDGVENKMKAIGMAHIIVVSGTHLSIIIGVIQKLFRRVSRFAALYFSIFLLIMYDLLIGWSPSVIRASFVAILSTVAWYFGRPKKPIRVVILTLGFCLLVNPYFLTNVSFQLSMLAYSGVVLIMPILKWYFYGRDRPGQIGSIILSSLAAIIMCLPIQLYYFGSLNLIALLANLLILPTIPFVMGMSFLTGIFGMFKISLLAELTGLVTEVLLKFHLKIINELYDKTEFLFEFKKGQIEFLGLYIIILVFSMVAIKKQIEIRKRSLSEDNEMFEGADGAKDVDGEGVNWDEISNTPWAN